jgi:hypothetical protein
LNQTALDNSTAAELLSLAPPQNLDQNNYNSGGASMNNYEVKSRSHISASPIKERDHNNTSLLNMSGLSKHLPLNHNQSYYASNAVPNSGVKRELCKEHGEELTYYCFTCQCKCICSECVVHGVHKNHEVSNVKRAYPIVVEKAEDLLFQLQHRIHDIHSVQNALDLKKKELTESTNEIKQQMSASFEEIRIRLQKREKEILEKADLFLQEHLQELNTYSRVLNSKTASLNKIIDTINSNILRKDEVNLLNFYSESSNKILNSAESDIPDIPDFNTIYNMKVTVNQNSFDSLINSLNGLHMEITSLKGFEVNKTMNPQRFAIKRDLYGSSNSINPKVGRDSRQNFMQSMSNNTSYEFSRNNNLVIF